MKPAWLVLALMTLAVGSAPADPTNLEGGVFIAHHPPGLQYSAGQDYCQRYFQDFAIDSCSEQNNRIDLDGNQGQTSVWYVLAVWAEAKEWCGAEFGFAEFGSTIYVFTQWGPCFPGGANDGLQLATAGWPGPDAGVSLSISGTAWSGNFVPVYWFMGYSYYEGEIPLAVNPASEFGGTANCETPPQTWPATAFGAMGIFQDGTYACPEAMDGGGGGLDGGEESGGSEWSEDEGQDGYADAPYIPPPDPSSVVSVYIEPSAIDFGDRSAVLAIESVGFNLAALRDALRSFDVQSIRVAYPRASLADTLRRDTNDRSVTVPDVSSFYLLEFTDSGTAVGAIPNLRRTPGIRFAEVLSAAPSEVDFPNDPHFESWLPNPGDSTYFEDAQWHLQNDGARWHWQCDSAIVGMDIGAQGGWSRGLGDSKTVIGIVDTGIWGGVDTLGSHEDLRVIPLNGTQRGLISTHPTLDWCWTHGTRMGGIAAAGTNNAIGVAGICGECSLLDIESACCCDNPPTDRCDCIAWIPDVYPDWSANINGALGLALPDSQVLRVLNLSFGKTADYYWLPLAELRVLWDAFATNRILVASGGNKNSTRPITHALANVPFVLGVGGLTWEGLFWDHGTTCYPPPDVNGTTVGYSDTTAVGGPAGRTCDVCAPASGEYVVTEPIAWTDSSGYYWHTTGKTSGASAQGAGLAGLLASLADETYLEDISADDVVGIIEATATPWPTGDDHPSHYADCRDDGGDCPAEYFGNGIINAEGATALVTDYSSLWRPGEDSDFCEWSAGKHGDIDPGSWRFTIVDSSVVHGLVDTMWVEYKAEAQVWIPSRFIGPPREDPLIMPQYVAWVRRNARLATNPQYRKTNTLSSYSPDMAKRIAMMHDGMTDCRLSVIDQADGSATISGYTYAYRRSGAGGELVHLVPEDSIRMAYVVMCNVPVAVEESNRQEEVPALTLTGRECQARPRISFNLGVGEPGRVGVKIVDVAGRVIRAFDLGHLDAGMHEVFWDARESSGARVPTGVYWVRAAMDGTTCVKRLLLLDR